MTARTVLACSYFRLRSNLVAGTLPQVAWSHQGWLTRTLQSLAAAA